MISTIRLYVKKLFSSKKREEIEKMRDQIENENNLVETPVEDWFLAIAKDSLSKDSDCVYDNDAIISLTNSCREIKDIVRNLAEMIATCRNSYENGKVLVEKADAEDALKLYNKCRGSLSIGVTITEEVKQVIVIRKKFTKDGNSFGLRRGKEIAQACHASMAFMVDCILNNKPFNKYEEKWFSGLFTKTVVTVDTEEELEAIYNNAISKGLVAKMVTDAGKTEFDGIPTKTALAIGPDVVSKIDEVTGHLKLY